MHNEGITENKYSTVSIHVYSMGVKKMNVAEIKFYGLRHFQWIELGLLNTNTDSKCREM